PSIGASTVHFGTGSLPSSSGTSDTLFRARRILRSTSISRWSERNGSFDDGCPRAYGLDMARGIRTIVIVGALGCAAHARQAQSTGKVEFEIVSIKHNTSGNVGNSGR